MSSYVVRDAHDAFYAEQDGHDDEKNGRFAAEELDHLLAMSKAPSSK